MPPLFYVMARGLDLPYLEAIEAALSLTPCSAVVVSRLQDAEIAWRYAPMVLRADDEILAIALAKEWAARTCRPILVIGQAKFLDAVYRDGHIESVETGENALVV